jgi:hypothetical protein
MTTGKMAMYAVAMAIWNCACMVRSGWRTTVHGKTCLGRAGWLAGLFVDDAHKDIEVTHAQLLRAHGSADPLERRGPRRGGHKENLQKLRPSLNTIIRSKRRASNMRCPAPSGHPCPIRQHTGCTTTRHPTASPALMLGNRRHEERRLSRARSRRLALHTRRGCSTTAGSLTHAIRPPCSVASYVASAPRE